MATTKGKTKELAELEALIRALDVAEPRSCAALLSNAITKTERLAFPNVKLPVKAELKKAEQRIESVVELLVQTYIHLGGTPNAKHPLALRDAFNSIKRGRF